MNTAELPCTIGCIVFAVAAIRAGVFPRWIALLLCIGATVFSVVPVLLIGLVWLGWSIRALRP